ncbi:hypothetical protein T484DRAFT_1885599, partial [Baffinella frigidus]
MGDNIGNPGLRGAPANALQMLARVAPQRVNGLPRFGIGKEEGAPLAPRSGDNIGNPGLRSAPANALQMLARVQGTERQPMGGISTGRRGQGWTGFLPLWTESKAGTAGGAGAAKASSESAPWTGVKPLVVRQGIQSCIWQYEPERERDADGNVKEPPLASAGAQQPSEPEQPGDHNMMQPLQNSAACQRVPPMATFRVGGVGGAMAPRSAGAAGGSGLGGMGAPESGGAMGLFEQHRQLRLKYQQDQQKQARGASGTFLPFAPILARPPPHNLPP